MNTNPAEQGPSPGMEPITTNMLNLIKTTTEEQELQLLRLLQSSMRRPLTSLELSRIDELSRKSFK